MNIQLVVFSFYFFKISAAIILGEHSVLLNVIIRDQMGAKYHLITSGTKKVSVMVSPHISAYSWNSIFHWTSGQWIYSHQSKQITAYLDQNFCLTGNPNTFTLSLSNCSSSHHQLFEYDINREELFFIHPHTQRMHPIYLENNTARITETQAFISRNPISKLITNRVRTFVDYPFSNASKECLRLRTLTLYALQKAMPNMTSIEYQKYMQQIEALNEANFHYSINEHDEFLIGDGSTVCTLNRQQMTNYGYYGLWHKNENNELIHFLSGKILQAVPRGKHRHFKLFEHMLSSRYLRQAFDDINATFYHLTLRTDNSLTNDTLTVGRCEVTGHNVMNINDVKVNYTLMIGGPSKNSLLLAFLDSDTYHQVQWILAASVHWTAMIDNSNHFLST